jgi:Putative Ig domain
MGHRPHVTKANGAMGHERDGSLSRLCPYSPSLAVTIATVSLLSGCFSEPPQTGVLSAALSENHPPSIQLARIVPDPLTLAGPAVAQIEAVDPDGDPVTIRYQWLVNGISVSGQTRETLFPQSLKRGDIVGVEVVVTDGKSAGITQRLQGGSVGNTVPLVSRVVLDPEEIRPGVRALALVEGADADADEVGYLYRWWRNGELVSGHHENGLDTAGFARGDVVVVGVTPKDRFGTGREVRSTPVSLTNNPPAILSTPAPFMDRTHYDYLVVAKDPEGDPLVYTLSTAPAGMKIDSTTGRIEWLVPAGLTGTHQVRVAVEDSLSGRAFQEFSLTLPSS